MSDQEEILELEIVVRGMALTEEGFFPKYRRILRFMRAFTRPAEAQLEDLDAAEDFLIEHIVEPADESAKRDLIAQLSAEQIIDLFSRIGGQDRAVPPTKPEASVISLESPSEEENTDQLGRKSSIA